MSKKNKYTPNAMEIYEVGGSIRNMMIERYHNIKLDNHDEDYVIVGYTPEEMLKLGYKQVGKAFPVFLNPHSKKEYALARKEIKTGDKHTDFEFIFSKDVTLEEDLQRRDFTCNALAVELKHKHNEDLKIFNVIDYHDGLSDIQNKIVRHIDSEHFGEDPLRILRACRFAAQLDFQIADETMDLMKDMVSKDMLKHLSRERIFGEFQKALKPGINSRKFIETMFECGALQSLFPCFKDMKEFQERPEYHGEGNTFEHTLLVLDQVRYQSLEVKAACLFHDIGKPMTGREWGRGHDSIEIFEKILPDLKLWCVPNHCIKAIQDGIMFHMTIGNLKSIKAKTIYQLLQTVTQGFKNKAALENLIEVYKADKRGRIHSSPRDYEIIEYSGKWMEIFDICRRIQINQFPELKNLQGVENKKALDVYRIARISSFMKVYKKEFK